MLTPTEQRDETSFPSSKEKKKKKKNTVSLFCLAGACGFFGSLHSDA